MPALSPTNSPDAQPNADSADTVIRAEDSGLWRAAERSLAEEAFPACKLFVMRGVRQVDAAEPALVGLLNCELVSVPFDYGDSLENLPQRIQKLDPTSMLAISDEAYVTSLPQLQDLLNNRDETTLVHHMKVQRLGLAYPERLLEKTYHKIEEADVRDWKFDAGHMIGIGATAGFVSWLATGSPEALVAATAITTIGSLFMWANTMITLSNVRRCLRNIALPPHPPSFR
jgi:hypothetical protein